MMRTTDAENVPVYPVSKFKISEKSPLTLYFEILYVGTRSQQRNMGLEVAGVSWSQEAFHKHT